MAPWFNVRKAAQAAAFFALKEGGQINVLKLTKLIYLADRRFMSQYDAPILGDRLVSMDHGPVNSRTLNYINGTAESDDWNAHIADRAGHFVGLSNPAIQIDDLDELSDAELQALEDVWGQFGHMDRFELRDWTHKNCPEWEDPHGSMIPIRYAQVFKFLGKVNAKELEERVAEERHILAHFG
ncbi:MAG: Panacea domain-containing protein [Hyphomicrobiaceae bacterium]